MKQEVRNKEAINKETRRKEDIRRNIKGSKNKEARIRKQDGSKT